MTITSGDLLSIVLEYVYPGAGVALNIFNYFYGGEDVEDDDVMDIFETFFGEEWGGHWAAIAPDSAELQNMKIQLVDVTGTVLRDVGFRLLEVVGVQGEEVTPAANAAYLQGNTAVPQVRGSKYIPALAEEIISNGIISAAGVAQLLLLLGDYIIDVQITPGNSMRPGVLSSKEGAFLSFATGGVFTDIPAYQRRRKIGVGS